MSDPRIEIKRIKELEEIIDRIHFHSGKFSVRIRISKRHLANVLKGIHKDCEIVMPKLKTGRNK